MDRSPNIVGETMEPKIVVTIKHDVAGKILDVSTSIGPRIVSQAIMEALIGGPITKVKALATLVANLTYAPEAHILPGSDQTNRFATIGAIEHTFSYLDCGRWGGNPLDGGQRSFGLIWGQWSALCEFVFFDDSTGVFDPASIPQLPDAPSNGINEFLTQATLNGAKIKLVRFACSDTRMSVYNAKIHPQPINLDYSKVHVILPDFHLPIVADTPPNLDNNPSGDGSPGFGRLGKIWNLGDLKKPEYTTAETNEFGFSPKGGTNVAGWNGRYRDGDIFAVPSRQANSRGAEKDLVDFIKVVGKVAFSESKSVHLVQLGDMYDLWIGLGLFFDPALDAVRLSAPRLIEYDQGSHMLEAKDFINFWILRTGKAFPDLVAAFSNFRGSKTFLFGNHDNYLAIPGYAGPTGIDQRVKEIRRVGQFIEHGHRGDSSNRDGAIGGHQLTQAVHYLKQMRALDPDRRAAFVTTAALSFLESPDFFVYAMGHTHSPYLTQVTIRTQLQVI